MRLLILLGLIYLCYRALKSWMAQSGLYQKTVSSNDVKEIDDIMIKDPFCEIYFPKKDGVHLRSDGKDLYFCSKACRDKFVNRN
ncbi:MAG: hypothetical protein JSW04_15805 [Desulfobacterales bacterium]|nr:MAG: hypothetical protein JSW04_15805 [Desulfobacterales bacterium]